MGYFVFYFFKITSKSFRGDLDVKFNKIMGLKKERNVFLVFKIKRINYIFLLPLLLIPTILFDFNWLGFLLATMIGLVVYLFLNIIYTLSIEYNFFDRFSGHVDRDEDPRFYRGLISRINIKNNENKSTVKFSLLILIFVPVIYSAYYFNVPFKMLSSTMNLISIRKENVIVYIKKEYVEILDDSKFNSSQATYIPVSKVTILFKGVGKNTYLQVENNNIIQRIEVPNDAILNTVIIKEK